MSYRWHSQRQGSFDALRLTWITIGTKRRKVEKKKKNKNKVHTKGKLQIRFYNNKRKEKKSYTGVTLSRSFVLILL